MAGIVLVREECRVRPTLGRVGERERNGKEEGRKIERRGVWWNVASF